MLLASAMFALMGAFVKLSTEGGATLAQVVLFRGLPSVVLLIIWARVGHLSILPRAWTPHVKRNLSGVSSMWLGFVAISYLPLSTATSLNYTAPLFIACWMLGWGGAGRDGWRIFAVAIGFLGVLTVLRPSITGEQWLPAALGLGAGALSAVAMMQIRELGRLGEAEWRTVLVFSIAVCLSSLVGVWVLGWHPLDWQGVLCLAGVGLSGMVGQLAMTRAFGAGSALLTAALQYTTIIFAALLGSLIWQEHPDTLAWLGMFCIIAAGLLSIWRTLKETREAVRRAARQAASAAPPQS